MTEATQTATNDAREASKSRVSTQETILEKLAPQQPATEATPTEKPEGENKDGEQKPKQTAQDRIRELANKRKEAEAKAEDAERRARELEARLNAMSANAKPMEASRPLRSQFASDDEYIEALATYKAKEEISRREHEQAVARMEAEQAEITAQWNRRQERVMKEFPDYAEVVGGSEINIPNHIHQAILESDLGPQVAYYLALNPDEAKRLTTMKPIQGIRRIAQLERELADVEKEPEPKQEEAPKVQKSKAPPPIEPVKSVPSASGTGNSYEEYKRRRQAEQRK